MKPALSQPANLFSSKTLFCFGFLLSLIAAIALFNFIFGFELLNPRFYNWVHAGDAGIGFFGFNFFNQEAWTFPPGKILSYSFPESTSLVYTDSIPLIATLLKLFSIDGLYQFQGLWVLLCFILQAAFSYVILYRHTQKPVSSFLGSLLFLTFPSFISRCFGSTRHFSLISHFIILGALALYFTPSQSKPERNRWMWLLFLILGLGTNFYLFLMVGILFFASEYPKLEGFRFKKEYGVWIGIILSIAYLYGYFEIPLANSAAGGFGVYSMNLNAWFNPWSFSNFLPALPVDSELQFEGYHYLGLGILILFAARLRKDVFKNISPALKLCFVFLTLLCLSYRLTFFRILLPEWITVPIYGTILFFTLPAKLKSSKKIITTIFLLLLLFAFGKITRATGRMLWPIEYFLLFAILFRKPNSYMLAGIVALQLADLSPQWKAVRELNRYTAAQTINAELFPEALSDQDFDHIALQDAGKIPHPPLLAYSFHHRKTIGPLGTARASGKFRKNEQLQLETEVRTLSLRPRVLYVVGNTELWNETQLKCKTTPNLCAQLKLGELHGFRYLIQAHK